MTRILATLLIGVLGFTPLLHGQSRINLARFKELLQKKNYAQAYKEAVELRKTPYGKCFQVDYIITKCLCESNQTAVAHKGFKQLNAYPLSPKVKQLLILEEQNCGKSQAVNNDDKLLSLLYTMANNKNGQVVIENRGKVGYVLNCSSQNQVNSNDSSGDFELKIKVSDEILSNRIFAKNEKPRAYNYYTDLLGNGFKIDTSKHFVIITKNSNSATNSNLKATVNLLEKAYRFYSNQFELTPPDKLITVYLMGDKASLDKIALKVHGITLPKANIGYSCVGDLSVLGNSSNNSIGTIYHELFHLFVRADIGDIPAWLDEGIASLFETSSWQGDILKGNITNWRTNVIKDFLKTSGNRSLKYMLEKNWTGFKVGEGTDVCDIAVNYAYSKHFAIFLQEKNMLKDVLKAFRDQKNVFVDTTFSNESAVEIMERCFQMKIPFIQKEFEDWFYKTYHFKLENRNQIDELRMAAGFLTILDHFPLNPEDKKTQVRLIEECNHFIGVLSHVDSTQLSNSPAPNPGDPLPDQKQISKNETPPVDIIIEDLLIESHRFINLHYKDH